MMYTVFLLSVVFVVSFAGFSSKPSPVYGGLGLVAGGGVGCSMVLSLGGSFLGLTVFLVYLHGMLVVFGYTAAMATEEYPEAWGSNVVVFGSLFVGLLVEGLVIVFFLSNGGVESVFCGFECMEDWIVFNNGGVGLVREDYVGVSLLYDYGVWLVVVAGWVLLVSVFAVVEVTWGG